MDITFFDDIRARSPRHVEMTWTTFANMVARPPVAKRKQDMRWIKFAIFGDKRTSKGCARFDDNVVGVTGLELDYDSPEVTLAEATARLARDGVRAALYSTPSYSEKGSFRVIVPFAETAWENIRAVRTARMMEIEDIIGAHPARESYALSQAYYFGRLHNRDYIYGITDAENNWCVTAVPHDWPSKFDIVGPEFLRGAPYF